MTRLFAPLAISLCTLATDVLAQDVLDWFDLEAALGVATQVDVPGDILLQDFQAFVPGLTQREFVNGLADTVPEEDRYFFNIAAATVIQGDPMQVWSIACTRYGLATRDFIHDVTTSGRGHEAQAIFLDTQYRPDDAMVWPDGALAVLNCDMSLSLVPEQPINMTGLEDLLGERFEQLQWEDDLLVPDGPPVAVATQGALPGGSLIDSVRISQASGRLAVRVRSFLNGMG